MCNLTTKLISFNNFWNLKQQMPFTNEWMANTVPSDTLHEVHCSDQEELQIQNHWIHQEDAARQRASPEREQLRRRSGEGQHIHSPTAADEPNGMFSVLRHHRANWKALVHELQVMARLAVPFALTSLFLSVPIEVSIAFCGHLSKLELDAAGLSTSLFMIFRCALIALLSTYLYLFYFSIICHEACMTIITIEKV